MKLVTLKSVRIVTRRLNLNKTTLGCLSQCNFKQKSTECSLRLILKVIMFTSCLSLSLIFPSTRKRLAVQALQMVTFPSLFRGISLVAFYPRLMFLFRYAVAANIFKARFSVSSIKGNERKVKPKDKIVLAYAIKAYRSPTGSRGSPSPFSSTRRQLNHRKSL